MPLSAVSETIMQGSRFVACINSKCGSDFQGEFYNNRIENAEGFCDIGSMILKMDMIMDKYKYPIQSNKIRFLTQQKHIENKNYGNIKKIYNDKAKGDICTFKIIVESREGSQWQCRFITEDGINKKTLSIYELIGEIENYCELMRVKVR